MELAADDVLHVLVAERVGLADQERQLCRQIAPPLDQPGHGFGEVVEMEERLVRAKHPGIEMSRQAMLVDARDLLGDERRMAVIVVDAGEPEEGDGDGAMLLTEQPLGPDLRFRIGPGRLDRRILVDRLVRPIGRPVHQHGAGEGELLDLELLKRLDQPARALHGDLVVERRSPSPAMSY